MDAKTIYFNNFGSKHYMKRNGEFLEYAKYKVSFEQEQQWTKELKAEFCDTIANSSNKSDVLNALWHLSTLEIMLDEKVDIIKNEMLYN